MWGALFYTTLPPVLWLWNHSSAVAEVDWTTLTWELTESFCSPFRFPVIGHMFNVIYIQFNFLNFFFILELKYVHLRCWRQFGWTQLRDLWPFFVETTLLSTASRQSLIQLPVLLRQSPHSSRKSDCLWPANKEQHSSSVRLQNAQIGRRACVRRRRWSNKSADSRSTDSKRRQQQGLKLGWK